MTQSSAPASPFAALAANNRRAAAPAEPTPAQSAKQDQPTPLVETPPQATQATPAAPAPAPAAAEAATPGTALTVVASASEPKTIQVLTSTGDARFDAIFTGTVGSLDARGCFKIDPDYTRLSYLFTLSQGSAMPVLSRATQVAAPGSEAVTDGEVTSRVGESAVELTLPVAAAVALKVNCIAKASQTWGELYQAVARNLPAGLMGADMLATERRNVEQAVEGYISESGLTAWKVPVVYSAVVYEEEPEFRGNREEDLLAKSANPANFLPDVTRTPVPVAAAIEGALRDPNVAQEVTAVPANVATHRGGLELTVEGEIQVLATSAQQAAQVATGLLVVANQAPRFAQMLRPQGVSIQHVKLLEPQDSYEGNHPRERG
jgi:hypothetical protein